MKRHKTPTGGLHVLYNLAFFTLLWLLSSIWLCRDTGSLVVEGLIHFLMMVVLDMFLSRFFAGAMFTGASLGVLVLASVCVTQNRKRETKRKDAERVDLHRMY